MDEHAPPVGADQPLNRRARAVGLELVPALAVAHAIGLALAIELRAALAETEERPLRQEERHVRRLRVEHQPLHGHAGGRLDVERRRLRGEAHGQVPGAHRLERLGHSPGRHAFRCVGLGEPAIDWHRRRGARLRGEAA